MPKEHAPATPPIHLADYHLETAEALIILIRSITESATDEDWNAARLGISIIADQAEEYAKAARLALDDA